MELLSLYWNLRLLLFGTVEFLELEDVSVLLLGFFFCHVEEELGALGELLCKAAVADFTLDSKEPTASYIDFIKSETRYSRLAQSFPERAEELFAKAEEKAKEKYARLVKLGELYN